MTKRVQPGDTVRLYGYPGTFLVEAFHFSTYRENGFMAVHSDSPELRFPASEFSVVERNGAPLPLLSAPLVPPADDYPHEPTFDYNDGPPRLARHALKIWRERKRARRVNGHAN